MDAPAEPKADAKPEEKKPEPKQVGQVVRKDGPESHFSKAGTPTMGGALILFALVISTVLWADPQNVMVWVVTAITASYGVIGWIDDARKIRKKSSELAFSASV